MRCVGADIWYYWAGVTSQTHRTTLVFWVDSMQLDILPLWAEEFWEAHDKLWQTPQTCHVSADPKLCDTKQMPRLPVDRDQKKKKEKKNQFRSTLGGRTDTADSSASGLYLSLFGLTLATSQWILRLICSCRSSIQCCYADLWTAAQEKRHKLLQQADSQPRNNLHDHKEHLYKQHVFRSLTILICRKQPGRLHGFQC